MTSTSISTLFYTLGVLLSVILGVATTFNASWASSTWVPLVLLIVGFIVGYCNITKKEVTPFLIGVLTLAVALQLVNLQIIDELLPRVGTFLDAILTYFLTIVASAAIIVSFRAVYHLAK